MKFFKDTDSRTQRLKKNVCLSIIIKLIDAVACFLLVPVTLGFLDSYTYGVWLTLNSIFLWIDMFDAGLGNGLKNRLTISLSGENYELSKSYISTTYFLLIIICFFVLGVMIFLVPSVNWYNLLNIDSSLVPDLPMVIIISLLFVCTSFVLKIITNVFQALQLSSYGSALTALGHLLSLIIIIVLQNYINKGSLLIASTAFLASTCSVYFFTSVVVYKGYYKTLSPSWHSVNVKEYGRDLLGIGFDFFVIQISGLIIFAMSNIVISRLFGPENVTPFNIANRYMSIPLMAMNILMTPFWSSITEAFAKNDNNWIKNSYRKVNYVVLLFGCCLLLMLIVSPLVYKVWLGDSVSISFKLSLLMSLYVFVNIWSSTQSTFLNGLNIMRLQVATTLIEAILFFPLTYSFGRLWGFYGTVIALIIVILPALMVNVIQVKKLIAGKANGIWLR